MEDINKLIEALEYTRDMLKDLGIDEEADENDTSPSDMTAHVGGLIWQKVTAALKGNKK